ncbi:MAG: M56 family metallopeptidase [Cyclobacteriaceae bacterium]
MIYLYYHYFLRNETCHNFKRIFLLISPIISLIIPLVSFDFIPAQYAQLVVLPEISTMVGISERLISETDYFQIVYITIATVFCLKFLVELFILARTIVRSEKDNFGHLIIARTNGKVNQSSFFNVLFLDCNKDSISESDPVIKHEIAHIRGFHSFDIVVMELLRIVLWFNPVIYFLKKEVQLNHEYIADSVACEDITQYQSTLAAHSFKNMGLSLVHNFNTPPIMKRLKMLKRMNENPSPFRMWSSLTVLLLVALIFSCESTIQQSVAQTTSLEQSQDDIYEHVDVLPMPKGGYETFFNFVGVNMEYPEEARKIGIEGRVLVQFIVRKDGTVTDYEVIEGIGHGCDKAGLEAVKKYTDWEAGIHNNQKVSVRMVLPINFKLG